MKIQSIMSGLAIACMSVPSLAQSETAKATVQSSNNVGFKLVQQALKLQQKEQKEQKEQKNLVFSPLSAHYALSMALNGTNGETRAALISALGYESQTTAESINFENAITLRKLTRLPLTDAERKAYPEWKPLPPVLTISNSIWSTNGETDGKPYNFQPKFVETLASRYEVSEPKSLDFKAAPSADVINNWVSDATNKMIPTIIDADTLSQLTWVILNATRFEAKWASSFMKPIPGDFKLMKNAKVKANMMTRAANGRYAKTDDFEVAELDFAGGESLKAYVVLPTDPKAFTKKVAATAKGIWSDEAWSTIFASLKPGYGRLTMPTFEFAAGFEMKKDQPFTKAMGLNFLFQNTANFSKMDGEGSAPSKVGIIKQDAKIKWDETGVAAAAATLVGGMSRSAIPRYDYEMVVDRPFYVAIYDQAAQAFVFVGQVADPTK